MKPLFATAPLLLMVYYSGFHLDEVQLLFRVKLSYLFRVYYTRVQTAIDLAVPQMLLNSNL